MQKVWIYIGRVDTLIVRLKDKSMLIVQTSI
jgi:hypothetical protein